MIRFLSSVILPACLALWLALGLTAPAAANGLDLPWPDPLLDQAPEGQPITFQSHSPFSLADVNGDDRRDPPETARGMLFMPRTASARAPVPAVIFLHGAAGLLEPRELTYARQFAARGIAALAIDVFGARRDRATSFLDRVMEITEAMYLADAYAGLRHLASRPDIDANRIALIGFSYGGMVTTYAAYRQVADLYAPNGPRFAAHAAYYGPCIAEFRDTRATGAPLMMIYGGRDAIIDPERCRRTASQLEAGGSDVEIVSYPEAAHQWDGRIGVERMIGHNIASCDFVVGKRGAVQHRILPLTMNNPLTRKLMLGLCADSAGYLIGRNDAVRAKSNAVLAHFLSLAFARAEK